RAARARLPRRHRAARRARLAVPRVPPRRHRRPPGGRRGRATLVTMPTRKQKRREAKTKRHDYEFVYLDGDGNELDEVPEELVQPKKSRAESTNGAAAGKKAAPQQRGSRAGRVPPVPSWNRAVKRGAMLGV